MGVTVGPVREHVFGDDSMVMAAADDTTDTGIGAALGSAMDGGEISTMRATFNPYRWLDTTITIETELVMVQRIHGTPNGFVLDVHPLEPRKAPRARRDRGRRTLERNVGGSAPPVGWEMPCLHDANGLSMA